ncbi:MAG: PEP-utilizing enzyme [Patescibacteria group bacterium]
MKTDALIQKFKSMQWEIWLHRRFPPFVTYLMMKYATPKGFQSEGIEGHYPISLYDTDDWYSTPEVFALAAKEAERYLKEKDIFVLTAQCEKILERGRREIPLLCASSNQSRVLFEEALKLIEPANVYIWIAHAAEQYYQPIIREAVRKHVSPEELEKFIGDISFPSKKNAMALLDDDVRAGMGLEELHRKYGWLKARGGFKPGYTPEEIKEIQKKILHEPLVVRPTPLIPTDLSKLAEELQELVYLRTLRTDALYEMYHLASPIFERYAKELGVGSLGDYIPDELLAGKINKIPHEHAILKYNDEVVVLSESIISQEKVVASEVKGNIAFKGFVRGVVRLVHIPSETDKVHLGDILVTPMTTAAYISAMHRAAAFVTDEGGITCHAAILARELKKPCIIGTKIATKVLKDGDLVEVDAEKGIVRILEKF